MTTLLDAALEYHAAELSVIPCEPRGKRPGLRSWVTWQQRRASPAQLRSWFDAGDRNIAIVCGAVSGVVAVDVDSEAARAWADLSLPDTPVRTRTAKGEHRFYRHPGSPVANRAKIATELGKLELDVRGDGGYVLAAPSIHPTGAVYERLGPWTAEGIAALPVFDPTWIAPPAAPPRCPSPSAPRELVDRAAAYLDSVDPAIAGSGGHNTTFRAVVALIHGFGLAEDVALELLLTQYNPRCQPPWSERELAHKVASAAAAGPPPGRERGWLIGSGRSSPPSPPPPPPAPRPVSPDPLEGLLGRAVADSTVLLERSVIEALAALCKRDPAQWQILREQLVAARVGGARELAAKVRETLERQQRQEKDEARRQHLEDLRRKHGAVFISQEELAILVPAVWRRLLEIEEAGRTLYRRLGSLAQVREAGGRFLIECMREDDAHGRIFRCGAWRQIRASGDLGPARPPRDVAKDCVCNPHPSLPEIEGIVTTPCYGPGWRLIARSGYDADARLEVRLPEAFGDGWSVPEQPTQEERQEALETLDDLLADFPFARPSDRAHAIGALLLPLVRRAIDGPTPLHDLEAPMPASGKSLLADIVVRVSSGAELSVTTLPRDGDEARKKITALLLAGVDVICWDNVTVGQLAELAAAITAQTWQDRELGANRLLTIRNRACWLMTANNPRLSAEIARRCVRIRIEPSVADPENRSGFRHEDLKSFVQAERARLVRAALVLCQAWLAAGRPYSGRRIGSFEQWCGDVGGILELAGVSGFLEDRDELAARADSETGELEELIEAWATKLPPGGATAGELAALAERDELLLGVLERAETTRARTSKIGKLLARHDGRIIGSWRLGRDRDSHSKRSRWQLIQCNGVELPCNGGVTGCNGIATGSPLHELQRNGGATGSPLHELPCNGGVTPRQPELLDGLFD